MQARIQNFTDPLIILSLGLLPFLFFWRLVIPYPADQMNIAAGDFGGQYFPLRAFVAQAWVKGEIPLWNPYLFGGQPALADIQSGGLYAPHLVQALLLGWGGPLFLGIEVGFPLKALEWQVVLHFSIAAVGTYAFVRYLLLRSGFRLHLARSGALIAALVFTFGGYLTGFPVQQVTILEVSVWLPWVLWGITAAIWQLKDTAGWSLPRSSLVVWLRAVVLSAVAFGLAITAGHPQTVMYVFYLSMVYSLFLGFNWRQRQPRLQRLTWTTGTWFLVALLGAMLAAAQLLPTLEFISYSVRANPSYGAVSAGLPLTELVTILYPGFFGGSPAYVGIVSLVLVGVALSLSRRQVTAGRSRHFGQVVFWSGAALLSLLLAFGDNLFLYSIFYLLVPGFETVRQQERVFLIYSLSMAVLTGFGTALLFAPLPPSARHGFTQFKRRLRTVGAIAFFVTGAFIYGATAASVRGDEVNLFYGVLWHHLFGLLVLAGTVILFHSRPKRWFRRGWGVMLLALLVTYNLFTVNWQFNLAAPDEVSQFTPDGIVQFLQTQAGLTDELGRVASGGFLPGGNSAASVYNLQDLTGNTPLQLAGVEAFFTALPAWQLWQLMNVFYVVDERDIGDAGLQPVYSEGNTTVYKMGDPFRRAWLVTEVSVVDDAESAVTQLAAPDFDLGRTAIVEAPLAVDLTPGETGTVVIEEFGPNRLDLKTDTPGRQLLVLSQIYYPGWQAVVDGQPAALFAVNLVQQGIIIPAGEHQVELYFWPESFSAGLIISGLAIIICASILGLAILTDRRAGALSTVD